MASPLLTVPTKPHGMAKAAIFTPAETDQYTRLVAWVLRLANRPASSPTHVETPKPQPSQALPTPAARMMAEQAVFQQSADENGGELPAVRASFDEPVDPFDPEIFNRRYCPAP
jgi:hypothetical protein